MKIVGLQMSFSRNHMERMWVGSVVSWGCEKNGYDCFGFQKSLKPQCDSKNPGDQTKVVPLAVKRSGPITPLYGEPVLIFGHLCSPWTKNPAGSTNCGQKTPLISGWNKTPVKPIYFSAICRGSMSPPMSRNIGFRRKNLVTQLKPLTPAWLRYGQVPRLQTLAPEKGRCWWHLMSCNLPPPNQDGFNPIFSHTKNWGVWVPQVGSKNLFEAREVGWNAPIISLSVFFWFFCKNAVWPQPKWLLCLGFRENMEEQMGCALPISQDARNHGTWKFSSWDWKSSPWMKTRLGARGELNSFKKLQV